MATKTIRTVEIPLPDFMTSVEQCLYYITALLACGYEESCYEEKLKIKSSNIATSIALASFLYVFGVDLGFDEATAICIPEFSSETINHFAEFLSPKQRQNLVDHIILSCLDRSYGVDGDIGNLLDIQSFLLQNSLGGIYTKRSKEVSEIIREYYPTAEERKLLLRG